jgi:archaetidylinositol phosphate synthase
MSHPPLAPSGGPPAVHIREHGSLLASSERRALLWMAERLPASIHSDHLSGLALGSMAGAGLSFAACGVTAWAVAGVIVSLALNWFGDSLDGTLARVRHTERPRYGFYIDHVVDLAGTTLLVAGLACSGLMHPLLALSLLATFLLVSAESYLATHAAGVFRLSFLRIGPTELRIILAIGTLKTISSPWVAIAGQKPVLLFDVGAVAAVIGLLVAFAVSTVRNFRALYAAEPLPGVGRDSRAA